MCCDLVEVLHFGLAVQPSTRDPSETFTPVDPAALLTHPSIPATLKHVIGPALVAAGRPGEGAGPAAQSAVADAVDAFSRLESATPGSCLAFVAQVMSEAVAAPIAGAGELVQLRRFAMRMAAAVQAGALDPPALLRSLQRWGDARTLRRSCTTPRATSA